jgi:hypothetical protein
MKIRACCFAILMMTTVVRAGGGEKLIVKVTPAIAFAPANLIVRAMIDASDQNRAVEVVAESPEFYRSSEIQLNGEKAPRTSTFEFRSLPSGTYEVTARLLDSTGKERASTTSQVNVMAGGGGR